jgi:NADPH-dependent glutamate synthase beta subunit-like oxidoreductase
MMVWGIPDYRLPRAVLKKDIELIKRLGAEIIPTPHRTDLSVDDLFNKGFKSVFLGVGAQKSIKLGVEGEGLHGVVHE